ncbi:putative phiE125 gp8 family phage protein [Maritalea mobilis]|uniref:Putative phiE125 gp8 family phage protein n=1 Tax=Maritalea mobilis TaxID=483324 RepID=A0A4R6VN07_9HYPH|nr:head-tail connector protein [Maritalea mobilis]TDQ63576.1 putative phiE125 gp8 family phage protein [Maritalea mobilis]
MLKPVLDTAPAVKLVSVAEAKANSRVDHSDEDDLIGDLIDAAIAHMDGYAGVLGRCMVNQTWQQKFTTWGGRRCLRLPFPDVSSVTITYFDESNVEQTVSSSLHEIIDDEKSSIVYFKDSFTKPSLYSDMAAPITVEFVAGYGAAASDVPLALKRACLLLVSHWYDHRAAVSELNLNEVPAAFDALIAPYRRIGV